MSCATDVPRGRGQAGAQAARRLIPAVWVILLGGRAGSEEPRPEPAMVHLFPPGVRRGAVAEWTVTGRNLSAAKRFLISGEGVEVVDKAPGTDGSVRLTVRAADSAELGFREIRADGPEGISNLLLFRVDHLPQVVESEPNDDPARANAIPLGSAVAGVLRPRDLDHFRVAGRAGAGSRSRSRPGGSGRRSSRS